MTRQAPSTNVYPAIRRLWPGDTDEFRAHLLRLDPDSRAMRFGGTVSDTFVGDYADTLARPDAVVFGAFLEGRVVAVAELRMLFEGDGPSAEAAFSVERPYQDHGIGDALLSRLIAVAQNRGIRTVYMMCLSANLRMRHLARKHDAQIELAESEVRGTVRQAWPDFASLSEEWLGEAFGFTRALLRL